MQNLLTTKLLEKSTIKKINSTEMKNIYFSGLAALLLLAACSGSNSALDEKKAQLSELEKSAEELNGQINILRAEIAALDTAAVNTNNGILVELTTLKPSQFRHFFTINGIVEADKNLAISTEAPGKIEKVLVEEGQNVSAGTVLATLNTQTLQSNLQEIKKNLAFATTVFERQKRLWDQKIGSEFQYLEAKNRKETLEQSQKTIESQIAISTLRAPEDGVVDKIYFKEGEYLAPGMALMQLVNLNNLKITSDISEMYLKTVKKGDLVEVSFPVLGMEKMMLPIKRTANIIEPRNRTFQIELEVKNTDKILKPNLVSVLTLMDFQKDSSIVIPSNIISQDSKGEFIFIAANESGKLVAKKTYIKTAKTSNNETLVSEGLKFGDQIISSGYNQVSNNAAIKLKQ